MTFTYDIRTIPFSRYGSFLTISYLRASGDRQEGVYLRTVRGGDMTSGAAFRIELTAQGEDLPYTTHATPSRLRMESSSGYAEICIFDGRTVGFRAEGVGVRLTLSGGDYDYAMQMKDNRWEVNSFLNEVRFMLTSVQGQIEMDAPWVRTKCTHVKAHFVPDAATNIVEFRVEEYRTTWLEREFPSFDEGVQYVAAEYEAWRQSTLPSDEAYAAGRELASYITWSCVVPADGYLTRPAMYMSKNWMTNIWSWDHCFNAMALVRSNPALAWDQFMIFFDRQDESGLLPDFMNDKYALWNCNKPPIHGWTLGWMMDRTDWIGEAQLREVYEPLARWTRWWYNERDDDRDGVPQYNHGNDSGWDNSTIFHERGAVESPDLCAYLVLQCETLGRIAEELGKAHEATEWHALAQRTMDRMLERFWLDGELRAVRAGSHERLGGQSLINYMPIILGQRLPQEVQDTLIQALSDEERFLSPNGFATESMNSPHYEPDGYWRGPIWAPVMMLLVDGLSRGGYSELAGVAAQRFCRMANTHGMAENFDAIHGTGLRDRAFTWTSSVYLMLANEYVNA
ncbi:MGH1-like glycoside hydrolase domain-containing protein [Paenibacillus terrigena]|uniref:amylo-alpha-1,6-glucosidase n=1 Tax=Paenibacillus terrigena TaxID=369333 RepID=UPI0028D7BEA3|nr:trehalase family glycosidase [Paenibacillus terrigena]